MIGERFDAFTHHIFFFLTAFANIFAFEQSVVGRESKILKQIITKLIAGTNKVSIQVGGYFWVELCSESKKPNLDESAKLNSGL